MVLGTFTLLLTIGILVAFPLSYIFIFIFLNDDFDPIVRTSLLLLWVLIVEIVITWISDSPLINILGI